MLYEFSAEQIVGKIIDVPLDNIDKMLKQNDQMLITWNKSQLLKRWPKCMISEKELKKQSPSYFTGMMASTNQKAYKYDHIMQPIKLSSIAQKQYSIKSSQLKVSEVGQQQFKVKQQAGDNQIPHQKQQQQKSVKQLAYSKFAQSHQLFSPFLPNRDNPFDRNSNSKLFKQKFDKMKIDSNRRNIAAIVEQGKKINESQQIYKFGRSLPKKAPQSIDIGDILRYTLGIKKQKQAGFKPQPIQNPFVRAPKKYDTLTDSFYKGQSIQK